jgi:pSer/pThr/pTyr-binding forkhead associated (FHA) protein
MERLVLSWVGKPFAFELSPGLNRLGRNPTNDFRVADASISGFHCELTLEPDGTVTVRDLASTNGTFIDDAQVSEGKLGPGQRLKLGSVELDLEVATVAEPIAPAAEPPPVYPKEDKSQSFLGRLTQTMRLPFQR